MVDITKPLRVKPIDYDDLVKTKVSQYDTELKRRRRTVDDEYRDEKHLSKFRDQHRGEYNFSDISSHELWQKAYFDKFGGVMHDFDDGWTCPRCHTFYAMGYPPEFCSVCGQISPLGELYQAGFLFRR